MTEHHCMWPGCEKVIPSSHWGCSAHWGVLPEDIRREIWRAYVPGQTIETLTPGYRRAIVRAHGWILKTFGEVTERGRDPGRWGRLVEYVRARDAARRERRAAAGSS